ncbi:putative phosphomannomutase [mine drainage metagenome]|uniref:Putative phosphomannomutase n=1 Tax=mine drainage metagenome TaxID=410659 RepID=A0A1J5QCB9_9ZZZZ
MIDDEFRAEVNAWILDDPDNTTAEALKNALAANDEEELRVAFNGFLQFGTAGLRGPLGAGPSRMNRAVVGRTALGLGAYLKARGGQKVVIGYDARHGSHQFAVDSAELLAGLGFETLLMPRELPTPVLAFAVNELLAHAGIMVTASHNPAQDNGYKVYLGGTFDGLHYRGSQIIPPADSQIANEIAKITAVKNAMRSDSWTYIPESVIDKYISIAAELAPTDTIKKLRVVHTSLHGVGSETFEAVAAKAGFADVLTVPEQAEPDPDFPTVAFPNPEEPGAIDLALDLASRANADLVIANDPDADRCAAAVFDKDLSHWRMLRGDEVGALLGETIAKRQSESGEQGVLATSIVSSSLLGKIAGHYGLRFRQTLTGFKWLSRVEHLAFGYEEALGYCVDSMHVNDKDGISAAVELMTLAANLKAQGKTLLDLLDEISLRHGVHATEQVSIRVTDLSLLSGIVGNLRANPPTTVGSRAVIQIDDLAKGSDDLPPTDGLRIHLDGVRIIVRPSGTEPKIKCYLEVIVPITSTLQAAKSQARAVLAEIAKAMRASLQG